MSKKTIKNKALKDLMDYGDNNENFLIYNINRFATSFSLVKKRKTVKIVLELPLNEISSRGGE